MTHCTCLSCTQEQQTVSDLLIMKNCNQNRLYLLSLSKLNLIVFVEVLCIETMAYLATVVVTWSHFRCAHVANQDLYCLLTLLNAILSACQTACGPPEPYVSICHHVQSLTFLTLMAKYLNALKFQTPNKMFDNFFYCIYFLII